MQEILVIHPDDNVGVALITLNAGLEISYLNSAIEIKDEITTGFKVALQDIEKGQSVIKYGETIGISSQNIRCGEQVHVHNCESLRGRGDK